MAAGNFTTEEPSLHPTTPSNAAGFPCLPPWPTSGPCRGPFYQLREAAHYTTIKMNTALRISINLTSIGSNFREGGEEILKERRWSSHSSKESWKEKPDGKGNCKGRTSPRSQAREHEQSPIDPSHLGGSIPLGCAAQEERAAFC
ncbi:unnamed protein product [Sphagnum jensenii]|uniref:Uncharacterized protein n=1 Tax=Sphagnum jensenii TaxID=128206 RepID=A0ABP0WES1_9BRYO